MEEQRVAPTVGRIVHFYTTDPSAQFNGQGPGPYPAIVTQVSGGTVANLKVMPALGPVRDETSVPDKVTAEATGHHRYWEWPPREV